MKTGLVTALLLALLVVPPAAASERQPTLAELEHEVMCPTCKTLLELSHAPIADRMRAFIRQRIAAGETKSQIKRELVAEFGQGVLAAPPKHGFGLLAWLLPFAALLAAGAVVAVLVRRWVQARPHGPPLPEWADGGGDGLDPALERQLERELARYDG
jgi:cytochrome c-type biogenesis protein CcmH